MKKLFNYLPFPDHNYPSSNTGRQESYVTCCNIAAPESITIIRLASSFLFRICRWRWRFLYRRIEDNVANRCRRLSLQKTSDKLPNVYIRESFETASKENNCKRVWIFAIRNGQCKCCSASSFIHFFYPNLGQFSRINYRNLSSDRRRRNLMKKFLLSTIHRANFDSIRKRTIQRFRIVYLCNDPVISRLLLFLFPVL